MAAAIIGFATAEIPNSQVVLAGANILADGFTSFAPDVHDLQDTASDPVAFGIASVEFMLDAIAFIWSNIFVRFMDVWTEALVGVSLAADMMPAVLPIRVALAGGGAALGLVLLGKEGCIPGV